MESPPATDALTALGFTETEALVYCELLKASPATGYRLAQAVGKAPANTYQALSALVQKGAALVDESGGKSFRAVPATELLAAMGQAFETRRAAAAAALARLAQPGEDERIYQLKSADQVMQRCRAMIETARQILLFDLSPEPFAELRPVLERAAGQGVTVAGTTYGVAAEAQAPFVVVRGADYVLERWPGRQLMLVADARQHLAVLLSRDGRQVLRGVWSDSAWLACAQHNGLANEIRILAIPADQPAPFAELSLLRAAPPGLHALVGSECGAPSTPSEGDDR